MNIVQLIAYFPILLKKEWKAFLYSMGLRVVEITEILRIESSQIPLHQIEKSLLLLDNAYYIEENNMNNLLNTKPLFKEPTNYLTDDKFKLFDDIPKELIHLLIAMIISSITIIMGYLTYYIQRRNLPVEGNIEEFNKDEDYNFERIEREIERYQELLSLKTLPNPDYELINYYWDSEPLSSLNYESFCIMEDNLYKENHKINDQNENTTEINLQLNDHVKYRDYKIKKFRDPSRIGLTYEEDDSISSIFSMALQAVPNKTHTFKNSRKEDFSRDTIVNESFLIQEIKCFPIEVKYFDKNWLYDIKIERILEEKTREDMNTKFDLIQNTIGVVSDFQHNNNKLIKQKNIVNYEPDNHMNNKILKEKNKIRKKAEKIPCIKLTLSNMIKEILINNNVEWEKILYPNDSPKFIRLKDLESLVKDYASSVEVGKSIIQVEILQLFNSDDNSIDLINKIRFLLSTDFKHDNCLMIEIVQNYRLWIEHYLIKLISLISTEKLEFSQSLLLLVRDYLTYKSSLKMSVSNFKECLYSLINQVGYNEVLNNSLASCISSAIISLDYNSLNKSFFVIFNETFSQNSNINQQVIFMKSIKYYICFNRLLIIREFTENPNTNKIKCCGYLLIQLFAKNIDNGIRSVKKDLIRKRINTRKCKNALINNPLMLEIIDLYLVFNEIFLNNDKVLPSIQYEILTNFITPIYSKLKSVLEPSNCYLEPPILKELQLNIHLT